VLTCALSDGVVEAAGDCDDADPAVHPDAVELGCNGLDDDCDGTVDTQRVPSDHADLATAVAALPDGSEICVEPGTYAERLDLSGRVLQFTGQGGAGVTVLDLGTEAPMLTLVGESETADAGDIGLRGFTVSGGDFTAADATLDGGFVRVVGSTLRLEDVAFDDTAVSMGDGGAVEGGLIHASGAALSLTDVTVTGLALHIGGTDDDAGELRGGFLYAEASEVDLSSLLVSGLGLTGDPARDSCRVFGGAILVDEGSTLTGADLAFEGADLDLECGERANLGGALLWGYDGPSTITGLRVTGNRVRVVGSERAYVFGLLTAYDFRGDARQSWSVVDLSDNDVESDSTGTSVVYGGVFLEKGDVTHMTAWNNHGAAGGMGGTRAGSMSSLVLEARDADVAYLDVRGNVGIGDKYASELVYVEAYESTASLRHFVIAGNSTTAPALYGMALGAAAELGRVDIQHGDIVGNTFTGEARYGVVSIGGEEESDRVALDHVQIIDNVHVGDGDPSAVYEWYETGETTEIGWCNLVGQDVETPSGVITGSDGNISADPLYVDVSGTDPTTWDLSLQASSPAIDAGDPTATDADGSRADLGAHGGAGGGGW
jgi:hypothetical protein